MVKTKVAEGPLEKENKSLKMANFPAPSVMKVRSMIRIIREFRLLQDFSENSKILRYLQHPCENVYVWNALLLPQKEPYNERAWRIQFKLPQNYPFSPPKVKFLTPIYHPNVSLETGQIKLKTLEEENWKASKTMMHVLRDLIVTIHNPKAAKSKSDPSILNKDARMRLKCPILGFKRKARKHAKNKALDRPGVVIPDKKKKDKKSKSSKKQKKKDSKLKSCKSEKKIKGCKAENCKCGKK